MMGVGSGTPETVTGYHCQQLQPDPLHQVVVGSNILLFKQWVLPENHTLPSPGRRCWVGWMEILEKPGFRVGPCAVYGGMELIGAEVCKAGTN